MSAPVQSSGVRAGDKFLTARFSCVLVALFFIVAGCGSPRPAAPYHADLTSSWVPLDSLNRSLPPGVRVFSYSQADPPLRAWYASIKAGPDVLPQIVIATDSTGRSPTAEIGHENGACLAVNGGYFAMDAVPTRHVGLLWLDDTLHTAATRFESSPEAGLPARAALGLNHSGEAEVSWAADSSGTLIQYGKDHVGRRWEVAAALAAGPMLLRDGEYSVTATEEGFARTSIPATHPRTAAGVTSDGRLILLVVDGRQENSRGVNLAELADLMRSAGAVRAVNLDGGGSSTFVVNGQLVNRPTGGSFQRPVMSAVIVQCR